MKVLLKLGIVFFVIGVLPISSQLAFAQSPVQNPQPSANVVDAQQTSPAAQQPLPVPQSGGANTKVQNNTNLLQTPPAQPPETSKDTPAKQTVVQAQQSVPQQKTPIPPGVFRRPNQVNQPAGAQVPVPGNAGPANVPGQAARDAVVVPPGVPPPPPVMPRPVSQPVISSFSESGKKLYNLNFDDVDIYSIIQTVFGEIIKVNYVIDPRVKGRATFKSVSRISQENILPIMEVILRLNGVAVVEEENLYRILPISEIAREPSPVGYGRDESRILVKGKAILQVIPVNHLQSSEMVRLVTPFLSVNASVVDVPKINALVIVDTDTNVKRLLKLIDIFDSELQKQKGPQVYVYPIQHSKAKDVASLLQQLFLNARPGDKNPSKTDSQQQKGSSTPAAAANVAQSAYVPPVQPQISLSPGSEAVVSEKVKIFHDEDRNAVIILGTPEEYKTIQDAILKLDTIPRQVLIEGMIAQVSLTDKLSMGLKWAISRNLFGTDLAISNNSANKSSGSGLEIIGTDTSGSIQVLISALATDSKAKLLASPHIMVADNREARIQVGDSVPIVTSTTQATTTIAATQTVQYKDIGIILKVKPQISDGGQVTLDLSQEVSSYSTITLYADELQIVLHKTEASTSLVVQDGQTIVIGGLIQEDDTGTKSGIPFLSKIPFLGYLFGNTDKEKNRKELVILLTPHVVKNQTDAAALTSGYVDRYAKSGYHDDLKKEDLLKEDGNKEQKK